MNPSTVRESFRDRELFSFRIEMMTAVVTPPNPPYDNGRGRLSGIAAFRQEKDPSKGSFLVQSRYSVTVTVP